LIFFSIALLGVHFDEFHWESQYGIQHLKAVLENLEQNGHLTRMPDGRQFVKIPATEKSVTLVKSDGSSLYLTRDLAAAIDRHDRFKLVLIIECTYFQ
jgi:arginyl-tRNA synthetase